MLSVVTNIWIMYECAVVYVVRANVLDSMIVLHHGLETPVLAKVR